MTLKRNEKTKKQFFVYVLSYEENGNTAKVEIVYSCETIECAKHLSNMISKNSHYYTIIEKEFQFNCSQAEAKLNKKLKS